MINLDSLVTEELKAICTELNTFAKKEDLEFYRVGFGNVESYLMLIPKSMIREDTIQEGTMINPHRMSIDLITYLITKLTVPRYLYTKESQIPESFKIKYPQAYKELSKGVRTSHNEISLIRKGWFQPFERFEFPKEDEKLEATKVPTLLMGMPVRLKKPLGLE